MDEGKQANSATNTMADAADTGAQTAARQEEATSGDTLNDLQQTQNDAGASGGETSESSDASSAPSPDGMPDNTSGENADVRDSGGPM
jgi:Flp pilus assembly protein TadG